MRKEILPRWLREQSTKGPEIAFSEIRKLPYSNYALTALKVRASGVKKKPKFKFRLSSFCRMTLLNSRERQIEGEKASSYLVDLIHFGGLGGW